MFERFGGAFPKKDVLMLTKRVLISSEHDGGRAGWKLCCTGSPRGTGSWQRRSFWCYTQVRLEKKIKKGEKKWEKRKKEEKKKGKKKAWKTCCFEQKLVTERLAVKWKHGSLFIEYSHLNVSSERNKSLLDYTLFPLSQFQRGFWKCLKCIKANLGWKCLKPYFSNRLCNKPKELVMNIKAVTNTRIFFPSCTVIKGSAAKAR